MSETLTTQEVKQDTPETLSADGFRDIIEKHGLGAEDPHARIDQLKSKGAMDIAVTLDAINRSLQGSGETLIHEGGAMKIGDQETIKPEDRYDVFMKLIEDIKACPDTVSPARIGDVLALGVVLLHPFNDGNGRTARAVGLLFRDEYDTPDYATDFDTVTESRDIARARGGFLIYGYTPRFSEGFDQSDPAQVSGYLSDLLKNDMDGAYIGCYGQAPLQETTAAQT